MLNIEVAGLAKSFGSVQALAGIDLAVPEGTVCALLGPNGAGKTTVIRILATLSRPDAGRAMVAGHDVARHPGRVRASIGLAGQHAAVDDDLTGRENLLILGQMQHLGRSRARARASDLLTEFGLSEAADRLVKTWSGGMRRRLDLIASLVVHPPVLFLDEPTTGLDPRSRAEIWASVRKLAAAGTTVLLSTQYLEEADRIADEVVIMDAGTVVAQGRPEALKDELGSRVDVVVVGPEDLEPAGRMLTDLVGSPPSVDVERRRLSVPVATGMLTLPELVRRLDGAGIQAQDVSVRRPTLEEVFLDRTGPGPIRNAA
jgi:ABC-2 type transport system ATP-binding protein